MRRHILDDFQGQLLQKSRIHLGLSPLPVRVTTRIIAFLVGNPYKPSFPLLLGGGTTQDKSLIFLEFHCEMSPGFFF